MLPTEEVVRGGSPFALPQAGAFNRDYPFLEEAISINKSQVEGNLFNGNEGSLRLDFNPGPNDRLFWQFNWAREEDQYQYTLGPNLRGFFDPSKLTTPNFQFTYIHTFGPTVLNEFRAGYAGNLSAITVELPGVPNVLFDDATVGFGAYSGYPQTFRENIYTYADMVSINHGKHNIKAGVDVRRNIENSDLNVGRPSYSFFDSLFFAIDAPYTEGAGVDPGFGNNAPAHLETSIRHWRNWEVGAYAQDDWKLSRRLTLNLGLRYDLFTRHTELNHLATTFLKGPGKNIIDDITTGAGQIKDATHRPRHPRAPLAGACGPGGFAPARPSEPAITTISDQESALPGRLRQRPDFLAGSAFGLAYEGTSTIRFRIHVGTRPIIPWTTPPTFWW